MVDVDGEYSGLVIDKLTGSRKGVLAEMKDSHEGKVPTSMDASPLYRVVHQDASAWVILVDDVARLYTQH